MREGIECRSVQIERARDLTPEIFHERFLSGSGKPVIVTDALDTWEARSRWSFDLFKRRYGSEGVVAVAGLRSKCMKMMKLADYIDYLDAPDGRSAGFWIDPTTKLPLEDAPETPTAPLYLLGWNAFNRHSELLEDVKLSPKFVEDWMPLLPPAFRNVLDEGTRYFSAALVLGPRGSMANLHYDFLHTHGYLAQILGRKRCVLFSPDDSEAMYDGKIDPDQPNLQMFPLFRRATAFECTLEPGELLFMPCRWWHHVVGIEKSITVSYNFFNRVNFGAYLTDLLQDLPAILKGLEASPESRAALGIDWVCRGFDFSHAKRQ